MRASYELVRDLATIPGFLSFNTPQADGRAAAQDFCRRCGWLLLELEDTAVGVRVVIDSDGAYAGPGVAASWHDCLAKHGVKGQGAERLR